MDGMPPSSWTMCPDEDVDMVDVSDLAERSEAFTGRPDQSGRIYITLDTNIFISHLPTVRAVHEALIGRPGDVDIASELLISLQKDLSSIGLLVPNTVIHELDRQKTLRLEAPIPVSTERKNVSIHDPANLNGNDEATRRASDLGVKARAATSWLLDVGRKARASRAAGLERDMSGMPGLMRLQKMGERTEEGRRFVKADDRILDCCMYFAQQGHRIVLWTNDKNLALQAEVHSIPTFGNEEISASGVLHRTIQLITGNSIPLDHLQAMRLAYPRVDKMGSRGEIGPSVVVDDDFDMVLDDDDVEIWTAPIPKAVTPVASVKRPEMTSSIPTFRAISAILASILSIPLYSALLDIIANNDPPRLRNLLGKHDPGPGQWTFAHVLRLMQRFWGPNAAGRVGVGVCWAGLGTDEKKISPDGKAKEKQGSMASAFAPQTGNKIQTDRVVQESKVMQYPVMASLTPSQVLRMEEAHRALLGVTQWSDYYKDDRLIDLAPLYTPNHGPSELDLGAETTDTDIMTDDAMMNTDNEGEKHGGQGEIELELQARRTMGQDWRMVGRLLRRLFLDGLAGPNALRLNERDCRKLDELLRSMT